MIIPLVISAILGFFIGYGYAFFAYRSYRVLWRGSTPATFLSRFGVLAVRMALFGGGIAMVLYAGWCDTHWFSLGIIGGYMSFYVVYGVMRWM